jgi:hypothetical protein
MHDGPCPPRTYNVNVNTDDGEFGDFSPDLFVLHDETDTVMKPTVRASMHANDDNKKTVLVLLDTGATHNYVGYHTLRTSGLLCESEPNTNFTHDVGETRGVGGTVRMIGSVQLSFSNSHTSAQRHVTSFRVLKDDRLPFVVGAAFMRDHGALIDFANNICKMEGMTFSLITTTRRKRVLEDLFAMMYDGQQIDNGNPNEVPNQVAPALERAEYRAIPDNHGWDDNVAPIDPEPLERNDIAQFMRDDQRDLRASDLPIEVSAPREPALRAAFEYDRYQAMASQPAVVMKIEGATAKQRKSTICLLDSGKGHNFIGERLVRDLDLIADFIEVDSEFPMGTGGFVSIVGVLDLHIVMSDRGDEMKKRIWVYVLPLTRMPLTIGSMTLFSLSTILDYTNTEWNIRMRAGEWVLPNGEITGDDRQLAIPLEDIEYHHGNWQQPQPNGNQTPASFPINALNDNGDEPLIESVVQTSLNGITALCLYDTGSQLSLIDERFLNNNNIEYKLTKPLPISGIGGATAVVGICTITATLGRTHLRIRFGVVNNLPKDAIIGLDALAKHGITIDPFTQSITVRGQEIPFVSRASGSLYSITTPLTIAPNSYVEAEMPVEFETGTKILIEPFSSLAIDVMEPQLSTVKEDGKCTLLLTNISMNTVQLPTNSISVIVSAVDGARRATKVFLLQCDTTSLDNTDADNTGPDNTTHILQNGDSQTDFLARMLIPIEQNSLTADQREELCGLLERYERVFSTGPDDVGCVDIVSHRIRLLNERPFKARPYKVNPNTDEEIERQVQMLKALRLIEDSASPWSSNVILVRKKAGSTGKTEYRLCVDYRKLNAQTMPDNYPSATSEEALNKISQAKFFSCIDLASGYWQIPVADESIPYTSFSTRSGQYAFRRMPFGLKNSGATLNRLMDEILRPVSAFTTKYVDDVCVYSETWADHLLHLEQVFSILANTKLKIKPTKCAFGAQQIEFLGLKVDRQGITTTKAKIDAILESPQPTNVKQLRTFLGCASYYRQFCPGFAFTVQPLQALLKKGVKFTWSPACESAFQAIKTLLTSAPVLRHYDFARPAHLSTDASTQAIGAVLEQTDEEGRKHPIAYFSKTLSPSQSRWSVSERELFAIVAALQHFRLYLQNGVTIYTDHQALTSVLSKTNLSPKLSRWTIILSEYRILGIEYRKGKQNSVADFLSRKNDPDESTTNTATTNPDIPTWFNSAPTDGILAVNDPAITDDDQSIEIIPDNETNRKDQLLHTTDANTDSPLDTPSASLTAEQTRFRTLQTEDPVWRQVIRYLCTGNIEQPEKEWSTDLRLVLRHIDQYFFDDILYRIPPQQAGTLHELHDRLICVPISLVPEVIHGAHGANLSGHVGETKTIATLKRSFYWPRMGQDTKEHIKGCLPCAARKPAKHPNFPLTLFYTGEPWGRVHMDIVGPFQKSYRGNTVLLTVADFKTSFLEAIPLQNATAKEVARAFVNDIILRYGPVTTIVTDNGLNFTSQLMKHIYELVNSTHLTVTAYHPQANAQVEKKHAFLGQQLAIITKDPRAWDENVRIAVHAHNTTKCTTRGYSPFYMMFGRLPVSPYELATRFTESATAQEACDEYVTRLVDTMQAVTSASGEHQKISMLKYKQQHDKHAVVRELPVGSHVMVKMPMLYNTGNKGLPQKLAAKYRGPYKVVKHLDHEHDNVKCSESACAPNLLLEDVVTHKMLTVHKTKVKPFTYDPATAQPTDKPAQQLLASPPDEESDSDDDHVEITSICGEEMRTGINGIKRTYFKVKYIDGDIAWVEEADLLAPELLREWHTQKALNAVTISPHHITVNNSQTTSDINRDITEILNERTIQDIPQFKVRIASGATRWVSTSQAIPHDVLDRWRQARLGSSWCRVVRDHSLDELLLLLGIFFLALSAFITPTTADRVGLQENQLGSGNTAVSRIAAIAMLLGGFQQSVAIEILFSEFSIHKPEFPLLLCGGVKQPLYYDPLPTCRPCAHLRRDSGRSTAHFLAVVRSAERLHESVTGCWCQRKLTTCEYSESFWGVNTEHCSTTTKPISATDCIQACTEHRAPEGPLSATSATRFETTNTIQPQYRWLATISKTAANVYIAHTTVQARDWNSPVQSAFLTGHCSFRQGSCVTTNPLGTLIWNGSARHGEDKCPFVPILETTCYNGISNKLRRCANNTMDFIIKRSFPAGDQMSPCPEISLLETEQGPYLQTFELHMTASDGFRLSKADQQRIDVLRRENIATLQSFQELQSGAVQSVEDTLSAVEHYLACQIDHSYCVLQRKLGRLAMFVEQLLPGTITEITDDLNVDALGDIVSAAPCNMITTYEILPQEKCFRQPAIQYRSSSGGTAHGFIGPGHRIQRVGTPCTTHREQFLRFGEQIFEVRSRTRVNRSSIMPLFLAPHTQLLATPVFRPEMNLSALDSGLSAVSLLVADMVLGEEATGELVSHPQLHGASSSDLAAKWLQLKKTVADLWDDGFPTLKRVIIGICGTSVAIAIGGLIWKCQPACSRLIRRRSNRNLRTEMTGTTAETPRETTCGETKRVYPNLHLPALRALIQEEARQRQALAEETTIL